MIMVFDALNPVFLVHVILFVYYRQISNIRRTLVGNKSVDHSDVVEASPVGALLHLHFRLNT